jgi:hypothetical protein
MVRKLLSALTVAAGIAVGSLVPAAAQAATAPPSVMWAHSVEDDFARIEVGATADAGVASIKIHVVSPVTNEDLAVVDSFHLVSGTAQYGWWQADKPVILPDLGYYQLNSEIIDNDGVHVSQQNVGTLVYAVKMFFKDLKVTNQVTYSRRDIAVSGRLMGRWPGTGEVKALENFPIEFVTWYGDAVDGLSGQAGHFELTTQAEGPDDAGYLTTLWDDSHRYYAQAYTDTQAPQVDQASTRLTTNLDRDTVLAGESVTVSGVLSWKTPQQWRPMSNMQLAVLFCDRPDYCGPILGEAVTDEQGRYSVTVTPYMTGRLQVGSYNPDPFVTTITTASADVTVLQLAEFTDLYGSRDETGKVSLYGHLDFPGNFTPYPIPVDIQFSKDGTNGWHTVTTMDIFNNPTNPQGISFQAVLDEPGSGYWRVTYAGRPDFQSAVSKSVYVA